MFQRDFGDREAPIGGEELIVYAGNLASYQGIDLLLQAFALLARMARGPEGRGSRCPQGHGEARQEQRERTKRKAKKATTSVVGKSFCR